MAKFNRMLTESCCVVVAIFHVPHMFLFARFKPAFSFANIALVAVTTIYFVNGPLPVSRFNANTTLTESQNQVLRLGLNFALAPKHVPVQKVIASVEKCLYKVTGAEATHIRSKVVSAI